MATTSTFIPRNIPKKEVDDEVINFDPFFPNVNLSDYRSEYKMDDMVTNPRLRENIETAIIFINDGLNKFKDGKTELTETQKHLYLRAIYHRTKIYILEQAKDIDTTSHGDKAVNTYAEKIKSEQQRERESIRLLTGRGRTTVVLV